MERFSDLYDQLSVYEDIPDTLHYTTRFLDGLRPGVRIAVALQKPRDLDTAYDLALLHEVLGDGSTSINTSTRRNTALPLPLPPRPSAQVEKSVSEPVVRPQSDDRWSALSTEVISQIQGFMFHVW